MRGVRVLIVATALLVLSGCWTVPGAGPQRSGHNPAEAGLTTANVGTLRVDWTWQAEWTTARAVLDPIASPAGVHVAVGHKLVTVDAATGVERWRAVLFDAAAIPIGASASAPAVEDGKVFVSVRILRNIEPGAPRGTHAYDAQTGYHFGVVATDAIGVPVPRDRRIVGTSSAIIGSSGLGVTGYFVKDLEDASASWGADLRLVDASGFVEPSSPAVSEDGFFFADGSTLFAYPMTEPVGCYNPIVGQPLRVCPPRWSKTFGAGLTRPTLTGDGQMLIVGDAGHLWVLQASIGADLWSGPLPTNDPPSASPSVDDDHVFVPTAGRLVVFDRQGCGAAACDPVWSADTGGTVSAQPAVAGGVVYTATTGGVLRAFSAAGCGAMTCAPLWEHDLGVQVTGAPAVSLGRLFVGTVDGRLISFSPRGGA